MRTRIAWGGALAGGLVIILLAPIWIVWCPLRARWRDHAYHNLLYGRMARRLTRTSASSEEALDRIADYVQTHMWAPSNAAPYDGKTFDYLLTGIGWCDYQAQLCIRLLATLGIPARYLMLRDAGGISPHTITEVWYLDRWGLCDLQHGIRFTDARGAPVTFEALSATPGLLDEQPRIRWLSRALPERLGPIHLLYHRVFPATMAPIRSGIATKRFTCFDRLLLTYAGWGRAPFVAWYQDQYTARIGLARSSTPASRLRLARHWHVADRVERARNAYTRLIQEGSNPRVVSESRLWLGVLEWEQEHPASALQSLQALVESDPASPWVPMAWYYMGRCHEDLGRLNEARSLYVQAQAQGFEAGWRRLADMSIPQLTFAAD